MKNSKPEMSCAGPTRKPRDHVPGITKAPSAFLARLGSTYDEGDEKYGPADWRSRPPEFFAGCLDHAMMHIVRYREGDRSEDHLAHAAANLSFVVDYEDRGGEIRAHQPDESPPKG